MLRVLQQRKKLFLPFTNDNIVREIHFFSFCPGMPYKGVKITGLRDPQILCPSANGNRVGKRTI
jgi:hypothetical protein